MKPVVLGKIKSVSKVVNTRNMIFVEGAKRSIYVRLGDLAAGENHKDFMTLKLHPASKLALLEYIDGMFVYVNDEYKDVRYTV